MSEYAMILYLGIFLIKSVDGGTVDLLFVLDGSKSVSTDDFANVKNWVKNITKIFEPRMKSGEVQIGVVQYSHYFSDRPMNAQKYIKTEIKIGQYKSYEKLAKGVDGIKHHGYTTYTGRALEKVVTDFRDSDRFGVQSNRQVMLLLTDGKQVALRNSSDHELLQTNANKLRSLNVTTYAVGVGKANQDELLIIAGNSSRVYSVEYFGQLDSLVEQLQTTTLELLQPKSTTAEIHTQTATSPSSTTPKSSQSLGLPIGAAVSVSAAVGIVIGTIASSAVWWWWWISKHSNKERNKSMREESGFNEETKYDDVRVDTQDQQPAYEVITQATFQEEGARRGVAQEPSYEPTYAGARRRSTYDIIEIDTMDIKEQTMVKKKEPTYEATYVDGRRLQSEYDDVNQETLDVNEKTKHIKKESGSNEETEYDDARADSQDQQPTYEVATQATSQEKRAKTGATQEPSYEPTYVDARRKATYDVIKMDTIGRKEPTTIKKKEPTYEATYVDGRELQPEYDDVNQEL